MSILEAAHQNDIDLEGSNAIFSCGYRSMSRLGCQVTATPEIEGIRLQLPAATRNFAVDGFVPKPH
ncbi:hypothetical protein Taro_012075 [Colocasia esculenta]|uniref:Ferredoxin n=1 Tax=Colocasia esculenta TaxID=4460 RepID=A0A843UCM9_COLES|nr:hypothetical protein [Colocasia esculenta]